MLQSPIQVNTPQSNRFLTPFISNHFPIPSIAVDHHWRVMKSLLTAVDFVRGRPTNLTKFFEPTVRRGETVWPKSPVEQLRYGIRWDYDGVITKDDGKEYHKFPLQLNTGKMPSLIKQWRDNDRGTHSVMAMMYFPKGVKLDPQIFLQEAEKALEVF
ncbi:hypothetical protein RJZ57_007714 [Blastomyces gilchristii]